jgi:hypothetical protein
VPGLVGALLVAGAAAAAAGLAPGAAGCAPGADAVRDPVRPDPGLALTVDGIDYRGDLAILESFPVQLAATVRLENVGDAERTLEFPEGCVLLLRAYRGGERVWDQSEDVGCTQAVVPVTLAPGERHEARAHASAYDVLDGGLPDGRYRITGYLRPDGAEVEVELGRADLAIPRGEGEPRVQ